MLVLHRGTQGFAGFREGLETRIAYGHTGHTIDVAADFHTNHTQRFADVA
jgi:hypothetical protein